MKTVVLRGGETVPALGMGTWRMAEGRAARADEIASLHCGLDLGMSLIDTAEMYGEGLAEELLGEALTGRRDGVFLVSKVYPHHASRDALVAACERSLRRLRTDRLDLYLLHWRGEAPLAETVAGFLDLQRAGKIRHFGVSNLNAADLDEWWSVPGGDAAATDQVLYHLGCRGVEWDLLPWLRARRVPLMAYSPIGQARLLTNPALTALARERGATPAQLALAWLLGQGEVIAIPKTARREWVVENAGALELELDAALCAALDRHFPPPAGPSPLAMI